MFLNLLEETEYQFSVIGYNWADVDFIGGKEFSIPVTNFISAAADAYYDSKDFYSREVVRDLVIVFKDGSWLERSNENFNSWWIYKKTPQRPERERTIKNLTIGQAAKNGIRSLSSLEYLSSINQYKEVE